MLERRHRRADRGDIGAAVDRALAVAVAGHGQHHLGLDDPESGGDTARPELGRARRPDRSEARGRQARDERLGDVRQVATTRSPRSRRGAEAGAGPRDLLAQLPEAQLDRRARLRVSDHRDLARVVVGAERVLGEVQPRTVNHFAPGMLGPLSTCSYGRSRGTRRTPRATPQNASRSDTDHCHSSS